MSAYKIHILLHTHDNRETVTPPYNVSIFRLPIVVLVLLFSNNPLCEIASSAHLCQRPPSTARSIIRVQLALMRRSNRGLSILQVTYC